MVPTLLIMSFTTLLCYVVVYKLVKARQAAHWPSVEGLILKSGTGVKLETHSQHMTHTSVRAGSETDRPPIALPSTPLPHYQDRLKGGISAANYDEKADEAKRLAGQVQQRIRNSNQRVSP